MPSNQLILSLQTAFSQERLNRYLQSSKGDTEAALRLYIHNLNISETLYGLLHIFEVTLRNALHDQLKICFKRDDWYDSPSLPAENFNWHLQEIAAAKNSCGGEAPIGKVIAELNLGFWTGLSAAGLEQSLWVPCLKKAFPHPSLYRRTVHARLSDIKRLRNRVSHHERILGSEGKLYIGRHPNTGKPLLFHPNDIVECLHWLSPDVARFAKKNTRLADCLTLLDSPLSKKLHI